MNNKAKAYWDLLMQLLGNPKGTDNIYHEILASYRQPHRFYHNMAHILNMLEELETVKNIVPVNNRQSIELAIWYHDIVYDTQPSQDVNKEDNETQSAHRLMADNKIFDLDPSLIHHTCELILATKHTESLEDTDAQVLVDLDLAILGKAPTLFDEYERNIRQEYAWVPEQDFRNGRAKILQSFLDRPYIYATSYFKEKYEDMARENLGRSVGMLVWG